MNFLVSWVLLSLVILIYSVSQLSSGQVGYLGPDLANCVIYYDDHKAIIKKPWPFGYGSCSGGDYVKTKNLFESLGYIATGQTADEDDTLTMLKP